MLVMWCSRRGACDVLLEDGASSVAAMRRTVPPVLLASILVLSLAACGSDGDTSSDATDSSTAAGSDPATDSRPLRIRSRHRLLDRCRVRSDCRVRSRCRVVRSDRTVDDAAPPSTSADKPEVAIPDEIPTELQVTVLEEGTGPAAETGDTVIVDYVGVRSSDGVEFDNSYDSGRAVPGGARNRQRDRRLGTGSRRRPDRRPLAARHPVRSRIRAPRPAATIIGENEALTFVVDVRAVIPATDPADAPTEPGVPASEGATEVTTVDLVEGDGPTAEAGQTAVIHLVLFRGDNGVATRQHVGHRSDPRSAV